jgi:hypothetical protein
MNSKLIVITLAHTHTTAKRNGNDDEVVGFVIFQLFLLDSIIIIIILFILSPRIDLFFL